MLDDILKDINFSEILDNISSLYEEIYSTKIFYRKIRFKGKIKKRYMFTHNILSDLLPSPKLLTMGLRHLGIKERI